MCGIAGILRVHPPGTTPPPHLTSIPEAWLDILDESIKHRGPDGQGRFRDRATRADGSIVDVALVHRRLSIIDHAGGAQPMVSLRSPSAPPGAEGLSCASTTGEPPHETRNADERASPFSPLLFQGSPTDPVSYRQLPPSPDLLAVVFNGCIYSHRALRAELLAAGHEFVTDHSDTEVLLHGWREWRNELQDHLEGMYAAALWDREQAEVLILNDLFSEKPVYSARWRTSEGEPDTIAWASTCPGLQRLLNASLPDSPALAPFSVAPWIQYGWNQPVPYHNMLPPCPGTSGLGERPTPASGTPSRILRFQLDSLDSHTRPLCTDDVDTTLRHAVHARLDADVPLGVFLSGGIDSAIIAAYARERRPDILAFTVRMPSVEFDESEAARETARSLGIAHTILDCNPNASADLVSLVEQLGLPFGDSSLLPSAWVARAARDHVKVALTGDGGDDLFLGYERQAIAPWLIRAGGIDRETLDLLASALERRSGPKSRRAKAARFLRAAAGDGYKDLVAIFPSEFMPQLIEGPRPPGSWDGHFGGVPHHNDAFSVEERLSLARRFDALFYLPCDLLRKSDTASMACALELRAPFLDSALASLAINASRASLMPSGKRKGLLRAVARKYLPREIVERPKMGFAIPVGEWFRTDFGGMRTLLLDMLHSTEPFPADLLGLELNRRFIEQMLDEHMNRKRDHSQRLYMLLVLAIWCRWLRGVRG